MTRRNRNTKESPAETLVKAPWYISVGIAAAVYLFPKLVLPASGNPMLAQFATAITGLASMFALIFLVVGAISFGREILAIRGRPLADADRGQPTRQSKGEAYGTRSEPISGPDNTNALRPQAITLDLLRAMDWKLLEETVAFLYRARGETAVTQSSGADGGVDIYLTRPGEHVPYAIVQCKSWKKDIGVKEIRELFGVMTSHKLHHAIFVSVSGFTEDARAFAHANAVQLLTGALLIHEIDALPTEQRQQLLKLITAGDYLVPTCTSCGIKMVWREGKDNSAFWGCTNYPKCRMRIYSRA